MSPELKDAINTLAERNNRSMNAEIVARLEASIDAEESPPQPIRVGFDDDFLNDTGLTREQFGEFVKLTLSKAIDDAVSGIETKKDK
jgi:plasmid stability protein